MIWYKTEYKNQFENIKSFVYLNLRCKIFDKLFSRLSSCFRLQNCYSQTIIKFIVFADEFDNIFGNMLLNVFYQLNVFHGIPK